MTDALVLAGGGVAGIAWETGVLFGIQEAEPVAMAEILAETTTLIGTSAGSAVAAQLGSGLGLERLFAAQIAEESAELGVDIDLAEYVDMIAQLTTDAASPLEIRRRLGAMALGAQTVSPGIRRAVIAARLPVATWPQRRILITAVDTATGELRVFDRDSGVELVDAVGASCAVPGVWPTVEIDGRHYMDGGMRTIANVDLAVGAERVLVIVPGTEASPFGEAVSAADREAIAPATVHVVYADEESLTAFGANPLDPHARRPSAHAGREVGRRVAAEVAAFWCE